MSRICDMLSHGAQIESIKIDFAGYKVDLKFNFEQHKNKNSNGNSLAWLTTLSAVGLWLSDGLASVGNLKFVGLSAPWPQEGFAIKKALSSPIKHTNSTRK